MKTKTIIEAVVAIAVLAGILFYAKGHHTVPVAQTSDYKNSTYSIYGQPVTLVNGFAETEAAPGSASKIVTQYFGNEATGDLNGDGFADTAFVVTQTNGGSGTFYYVVVALKTADGYQGTNGLLLGDRIAPQTIEFSNGRFIVNYAERKGGEAMTTPPSVGVTMRIGINPGTTAEIAPLAGLGEHCGGNMSSTVGCDAGYTCAPTPGSHLPFGDVGGICVVNK